MKTPRTQLNPFIVLSDVTITTLVIMCCLLMLFTASLLSQARLAKNKELVARHIEQQQKALIDELNNDRVANRSIWDTGVSVQPGRGLQSCVFRILGSQLFDPKRPSELSEMGHRVVKRWAEKLGPHFAAQQLPTPELKVGCLNEIQIRGHCSPESAKAFTALTGLTAPEPGEQQTEPTESPTPAEEGQPAALHLTAARALSAANDMISVKGFPAHLLTIGGLATNRPAYRPSEQMAIDVLKLKGNPITPEAIGAMHIALKRERAPKPSPYMDRIDILLVYSGDGQDNSFVAPTDGRQTYGPLNDPSDPRCR